MLFEDNSVNEIEYNSEKDEINKIKKAKSKSERVLEGIIKEEMSKNPGKPEIDKRSRKLANKQLNKFVNAHREQ